MATLFYLSKARRMLTACWQQAVAIPGQHFNSRGFVHDDSLWPRKFPAALPHSRLGAGAPVWPSLPVRGYPLGNGCAGLAFSHRNVGIRASAVSWAISRLLTPRWQQRVARVGPPSSARSGAFHDYPLWLWRRFRLAGEEPICDQDRSPVED